MIKKIGRPRKIFITRKLALVGLKRGQKVYKVKLGWKRTSILTVKRTRYTISKKAVKNNTKDYIEKNRELIKRLANL